MIKVYTSFIDNDVESLFIYLFSLAVYISLGKFLFKSYECLYV